MDFRSERTVPTPATPHRRKSRPATRLHAEMDRQAIDPDHRARSLATILQRLAIGDSMNAICSAEGMPSREAVRRWCAEERELADQVLEAREAGFHFRAEKAVADAKACADPIKGRLGFDAERWFLGKLSIAFAERAPRIDSQTNVQVNIDGDPFRRFADLMDTAASSLAGGARRTTLVAPESPPGPDRP